MQEHIGFSKTRLIRSLDLPLFAAIESASASSPGNIERCARRSSLLPGFWGPQSLEPQEGEDDASDPVVSESSEDSTWNRRRFTARPPADEDELSLDCGTSKRFMDGLSYKHRLSLQIFAVFHDAKYVCHIVGY